MTHLADTVLVVAGGVGGGKEVAFANAAVGKTHHLAAADFGAHHGVGIVTLTVRVVAGDAARSILAGAA
jgi:hypothetical protein